jgi:segregation and condensation protein A
VTLAALELDLEVFSGPFDLLLTLVLREEIDLFELELADVVLAYLDHLEARGELDLEVATEFIVLVASLLELKSRLLLGGEDDELFELEPGEAAEELLARMLEARRYRSAAEHLEELLRSEEGHRYRRAPLPSHLRRQALDGSRAVYDPELLGRAVGGLLRWPPAINLRHLTVSRVSLAERLTHLRALLRAEGSCRFDEAVVGADRVTVAVTLFALLELYKQGEATWEQDEPFGDITIRSLNGRPREREAALASRTTATRATPDGARPDGATPDGAMSEGVTTSDGAMSEGTTTSDGAMSEGATP